MIQLFEIIEKKKWWWAIIWWPKHLLRCGPFMAQSSHFLLLLASRCWSPSSTISVSQLFSLSPTRPPRPNLPYSHSPRPHLFIFFFVLLVLHFLSGLSFSSSLVKCGFGGFLTVFGFGRWGIRQLELQTNFLFVYLFIYLYPVLKSGFLGSLIMDNFIFFKTF